MNHPSPAQAVREANPLGALGFRQAARVHIANAAPGIPALCANQDPQTIAEALGALDDGYRRGDS